MAFGKELVRLRKASNMSVQKFANTVGINADRIRKWEQRDLNPRYDDTKKIETCYDINIDELVKLQTLPEVKDVPGTLGIFNEKRYGKETNKSEDAILSLVESNKILAESSKILADGNKKLIESNSELAQIVKSLTRNDAAAAIGNALTGIEPIPPHKFLEFLLSSLSPAGKNKLGEILRNLKLGELKENQSVSEQKKTRVVADSR